MQMQRERWQPGLAETQIRPKLAMGNAVMMRFVVSGACRAFSTGLPWGKNWNSREAREKESKPVASQGNL